jgi:hypothetical protein
MQVLAHPYPVRVEGHFDRPSRWLWLVKWLLALPHYVILAFLWCAFCVLSVIAFVAVLFTGRYPRGIFAFNVGVLRWSWRVAFYAYGANGTDRYPPFTLADLPDYPARLQIEYPERQRKGFALIGWWLAGFPHYVIAGVLAGGAGVAAWRFGWFGLIGLLVLCGALVLLFRGEYPRSLFDFVLGLNRWVIRVAAYAAVMTPEYPPFRVDAGEDEPGGMTIAAPQASSHAAERSGAGFVALVVFGSLAALVSLALVIGGGVALTLDQTQRTAGYLMSHTTSYSTGTYALVSDSYRTGGTGDLFAVQDVLGSVRIRTTSDRPVFVGIAPARSVDAYLGHVRRAVGTRFDAKAAYFRVHGGGAPAVPPAARRFWAASSVGAGTQTLTWKPRDGSWRIVLMNADGSRWVNAEVSIGARFPQLLWIGLGLFGAAALAASLAAGLIVSTLLRR